MENKEKQREFSKSIKGFRAQQKELARKIALAKEEYIREIKPYPIETRVRVSVPCKTVNGEMYTTTTETKVHSFSLSDTGKISYIFSPHVWGKNLTIEKIE